MRFASKLRVGSIRWSLRQPSNNVHSLNLNKDSKESHLQHLVTCDQERYSSLVACAPNCESPKFMCFLAVGSKPYYMPYTYTPVG